MKTLRRISAATILSLTLAVCALAGHMDTTGYVPPSPPPSETSTLTSTTTSIVLTILSVIYR